MNNDDLRDRPGTLHNDGLSKRTHLGGVPFSDMAALNENSRITAIGRAALNQKSVVFMVDSDICDGCKGKADRYIAKLHAQFPDQLEITKQAQPLTPLVTHVLVKSKRITKEQFVQGK